MAETVYSMDEIYPNQPLAEVSCEINFPFILAIQNESHLIQKKLPDYSIVSGGKRSDNSFIDEYKFENISRTVGVKFSGDKIAFFDKKYSGHNNFIKNFLNVVEVFTKYYEIKKVNQLRWNYINLIPFEREKGAVPFSRFFNISLKAAGDITDKTRNILFCFDTLVNEGIITTKIEIVLDKNTRKEHILLDNDFSLENIEFDQLESAVKKAHKETRDLFEKYITDDYRKLLKG